MDEASIPYTVVNTPFGLYEWLMMPQGMKNALAIHQCRVNHALWHIGKICHIYLDDIIIWSDLVEEHMLHVWQVLDTLCADALYCNPKKSEFFLLELNFLGHHILRRGIEVDEMKVSRIREWPQPTTASHVRQFLGLMSYLASFLLNLVDHTRILSPLMTEITEKKFLTWTDQHQIAFNSIKELVSKSACLTVIDHMNPGDNKIFLTCDASDFCTGAVLSWGLTWETVQPVAYNSIQLTGVQLNYPVHEKELLAIICGLKKWRSDLLGSHVEVFTDHHTLEKFEGQKDLSCRQARWLEVMSQFEMTISYIKGEDNCIADALSCLPPDDSPVTDSDPDEISSWKDWLAQNMTSSVNATLSISSDSKMLDTIHDGYKNDDFCTKFISGETILPEVKEINSLWYIGDRLLVPQVGSIQEDLFHLAHETLGHFRADKSYATLCDSFYWPNMR